MAKVTAPLLSFGGSGQVGKSIVFGAWRGIKYARQHVTPANPRTTAQQATRTLFAELREMWKLAPDIAKAPWNLFAQGRPFLGFNKFVGENLRVLLGEVLFTNFIGSPGARGGIPSDSVTVTTGGATGEIDIAAVNPTPPDGWSITALQAMAFPDQIPGGIFDGTIVADESTVDPTALTLTVPQATTDYVVAVWLQWEKPDGTVAYSVGVTDTVESGT